MPLQIPHPSTPLHLYRHLLREASYLPPLCRPWITSRITSRFCDCRHKENPKRYIQQAHHDLRYLRSANAGHLQRLLHLCHMATGRVGKRRRQLASAELKEHAVADTAALEEDIKLEVASLLSSKVATDFSGREPDWLSNWSTDKIYAIAASQVARQSGQWPHNMRRVIDPQKAIPTENCFGRPLTKKLARNKLKRHWVSILRQLLPPLPRGEWDRLAALARGEVGEEELKPPTRRPVAQSLPDTPEPAQSSWIKYVTKPARAVERGNSRKMKSLTGEEDDDPRGHGRPIGTRRLGPRKLKRLYGRVWEACPIMEPNTRTGKWSVTWGNTEQRISRPSTRDFQFFEGVKEDGTRVT
ncbi:hypothetical protein F5X99DRAFT_417338 [Biscogniauxia marginata]|nr:hypothetical protein F5X99DRAFT_417338 [Biscogniauxia marginata]